MSAGEAEPHRRRIRYAGKNPRRFEDKYKELQPDAFPETLEKVLASGKTPAGTHRPVMVAEVLEALQPRPGEFAVDATLGYGGHAVEILRRLLPGGFLLGVDRDPLEQPRTLERLRAQGFGEESFATHRGNFAGLSRVLAARGGRLADLLLADLGVSSMQLDNPARGFSLKTKGPLDMRMNPATGETARSLLARLEAPALADLLRANADEPQAEVLGRVLAGRDFRTTEDLSRAIGIGLLTRDEEERADTIRRVFQALRIAVNSELSSLASLLRELPMSLAPGGRVVLLSFHSGEDRLVKQALAAGLRDGTYARIADQPVRPTPEECRANPRASSTKLRWAIRAR